MSCNTNQRPCVEVGDCCVLYSLVSFVLNMLPVSYAECDRGEAVRVNCSASNLLTSFFRSLGWENKAEIIQLLPK